MTATEYTSKAEGMGQDSQVETVLRAAITVSDLLLSEDVSGPQQIGGQTSQFKTSLEFEETPLQFMYGSSWTPTQDLSGIHATFSLPGQHTIAMVDGPVTAHYHSLACREICGKLNAKSTESAVDSVCIVSQDDKSVSGTGGMFRCCPQTTRSSWRVHISAWT